MAHPVKGSACGLDGRARAWRNCIVQYRSWLGIGSPSGGEIACTREGGGLGQGQITSMSASSSQEGPIMKINTRPVQCPSVLLRRIP
eukprot:4683311-Pyramimonas_sp.AAC.1